MRLIRSSLLPCSAERLVEELRRPALLLHVAAPMVEFVPLDPPEFGERFAPGTYRTRLLIGGRLSIGEHTLDLQPIEPGPVVWHDAGHSPLIRVWDHVIEVVDVHGMARYTDRVDIHAGPLTLPAWLFAWVFYRHRQRRLTQLAEAWVAGH